MTVVAVVLAGGASRRFGSDKLAAEAGGESLLDLAVGALSAEMPVIVVGPEGGITEAELEAFSAVGAEPLRMGSSVLRSSTAGVAAAAALLARTPRWR